MPSEFHTMAIDFIAAGEDTRAPGVVRCRLSQFGGVAEK